MAGGWSISAPAPVTPQLTWRRSSDRPARSWRIERSARFLEVARKRCRKRGLNNVEFREADLMEASLGQSRFRRQLVPLGGVLCFFAAEAGRKHRRRAATRRDRHFSRVQRLRNLSFHADAPALEKIRAGGDGELARDRRRAERGARAAAATREAGMRVIEIRPQVRRVSPRDYTWQWPASFIEINLARLQELGRLTPEWAAEVLREFKKRRPTRARGSRRRCFSKSTSRSSSIRRTTLALCPPELPAHPSPPSQATIQA